MTSSPGAHRAEVLTIGSLMRRASKAWPDHDALVHGAESAEDRRRWTYRELQHDVDRLTSVLLERFTPGERVGLWAPNVPHWIVAQVALANAGLVMVSMNPAFRADEAEFVLRESEAAGLLVAQRHGRHELASVAREIQQALPGLKHVLPMEDLPALIDAAIPCAGAPAVAPDAIAQIQFTSGTTGRPKGAMLRHCGIVRNATLMAERTGLGPDTVFVRPSLLYHVGGSVASSIMNLAGGGTIIPMARWSADLAVDLINQEGGTLTGGVPTMMRALLESAEASGTDVSTLRTVILGAAPIPAELVADLRSSLGIETVTMYGQTESGPTVTMTSRSDSPRDTAETVGTLLADTEARVVDRESKIDLPPGEIGELLVRSPMLMAGYFGDSERTRAAIDANGWLHTGDLCAIDDRGYVTVAGRTTDMIIRGGANVYPREIEDVLLTHPAVADVAVLGVPDPRLGEDVAAFVRLAAGATVSADELQHAAEERLARFKVPSQWFVVDEFPLTASAKIQKHILRDELASAVPLSRNRPPTSPPGASTEAAGLTTPTSGATA